MPRKTAFAKQAVKAAEQKKLVIARARGRGRQQISRQQPSMSNPERALAMRYLDPWRSQGLKWPDANGANSLTLTVYTRFTLTPYADGGVISARVYPGSLAKLYYVASDVNTTTGGTVSDWGSANACANYTDILASYSGFRVVSAGARIQYIGNDYNNAGGLVLRGSVSAAHATADPPVNKDSYTPHFLEQPYKKAASWVASRTGVEAEHYDLISKDPDDNWTNLSIFIYGADTTTPQSAQVTVVQNLELVPIAGTTLAQASSPAAPQHVSLVQNIHNASVRVGPFRPSG